jgi:hypothetical protein
MRKLEIGEVAVAIGKNPGKKGREEVS